MRFSNQSGITCSLERFCFLRVVPQKIQARVRLSVCGSGMMGDYRISGRANALLRIQDLTERTWRPGDWFEVLQICLGWNDSDTRLGPQILLQPLSFLLCFRFCLEWLRDVNLLGAALLVNDPSSGFWPWDFIAREPSPTDATGCKLFPRQPSL